ncbi:hypothetical protein L218DRAFT_726280 [Marasmius fiardii PR-910]|nr:hypothetical protein L218DRAFT_726280 [Marasmius fiardii PR-910]
MRQDLVDDNTDDIIPLVPLSSAEVEQAVLEMCNGSHVPQAETPQLEPTLGGHRLLPHQITGTKFMIYRENIENMKFGGILADETGLGKTAQACALIKYDHAKNPRKVRYHPTCVVVPKALTSQWEAECEKFLPGMKVAVYCNPKRHSIYQLLKSDIIITTYDTVRCEYALYQSSKDPLQCKDFLNGGVLRKQKNGRNLEKVELNDALFRIPFRRVVLDESHIIKNHTTERAAACYRLQSTFRWCLTATPMHNSVMEYHSQLRFLRISPYSDIDWFKTGIENPIGKKAGTGSKKAMRKLQLCLTQVLLRRHKDGYTDGVKNLDLPEVIVHCDPEATRLSCEEMEIYNALQDRFSAIVRQFELSTHCVFVLLLRLRQACLHPSLLLKTYKKDAQEILKRMNESEGGNRDDATEFDWHNGRAYCDLCGAKYSEIRDNSRAHKIACKETLRLLAGYSCVSGEQRTMSERVKAVFRTLRRIPKGEKVIVFSQFTSMLYVLQGFLIDEGMSFVRHDGSMDQKSRQKSLQVIRDQRSGVEIILMSLQASAFGLNLPQCNHVIFTDIWWNPAIEYQAISRVDRIDQKRQVHVYKLVADETIESRMLLMQEEKRKLAAMTLASDQLEEVKRLDKAQIIELITGRDPRRF